MDKIATIVWLVLMVAFLIAEASTVQLICIWFAAGSLSAMLVGLLGADLWLQILVFFVVSIVLARLLEPELYGTIALVTVITAILNVFVDSGMANALIQKKDSKHWSNCSTTIPISQSSWQLILTLLAKMKPTKSCRSAAHKPSLIT